MGRDTDCAGSLVEGGEQAHSAGTGWAKGNEYGYGFWVDFSSTPPAIAATGRGGQRIRVVVPEKNLIVVLVGRFDVNDVNHFITEAIMSDHAIPEDLEGRTLLEAAIAAAARPSAPRSPSALPPLAGEVSGETFSLDDNPLGLKTLSVSFHSPSEATVRLRFGDGRVEQRPVGLQELTGAVARIELRWGDSLLVDPLTPTLAMVAAPYHELRVDTAGRGIEETGYFTGLAELGPAGWKFRNAHWSVAGSPPLVP